VSHGLIKRIVPNTPQPNREKEIFEQALDLESVEERQRFLAQACGDDAALLARVQALLLASEEGSRFLPDEPAQAPTVLAAAVTEKAGDHIGRYKLLQQIGEGGCGIVYMAEQEEPVQRRVALKVIKLGMDTKQVIARFCGCPRRMIRWQPFFANCEDIAVPRCIAPDDHTTVTPSGEVTGRGKNLNERPRLTQCA
jgi:hypothetical protein